MLCPVCRQEMLIVEFEEIELDACPDCQGLWFDAQELRQLFEVVDAPDHALDLELQLSRLKNRGERRKCPRCRGRLEPVLAPTEQELILDECPRGHGLWFDKGELATLLSSVLGQQCEALEKVRYYLGNFAAARDPSDRPPEST